jgi:predicted RNA-binding protein YlxR (DUF448 family)
MPERRCILTGDRADPARLIRLALGPDGQVAPDVRARAPGRGAWIGVRRDELEAAQAKGKLKAALARAFKTGPITIPDDLPARTADALQRNALDRMGLEARGGTLITGAERIEKAARSGQVHLLLHAADAGTDGNRKLDQAWRVGQDAEGSDARGLVLAWPRTILSLALGRENVVHVAVTDRGAAGRVHDALARWHDFIGRDLARQPCETHAQGSSPAIDDDRGADRQDED